MKTIKINGKEYAIKCDMWAVNELYRETKIDLVNGGEIPEDKKLEFTYHFAWHMLSDEAKHEVTVKDIMRSIDNVRKYAELEVAVASELNEFTKILPGDDDQTDRHEVDGEQEEKEEGEPDKYEKNA